MIQSLAQKLASDPEVRAALAKIPSEKSAGNRSPEARARMCARAKARWAREGEKERLREWRRRYYRTAAGQAAAAAFRTNIVPLGSSPAGRAKRLATLAARRAARIAAIQKPRLQEAKLFVAWIALFGRPS